jgi:hypothetical protein
VPLTSDAFYRTARGSGAAGQIARRQPKMPAIQIQDRLDIFIQKRGASSKCCRQRTENFSNVIRNAYEEHERVARQSELTRACMGYCGAAFIAVVFTAATAGHPP